MTLTLGFSTAAMAGIETKTSRNSETSARPGKGFMDEMFTPIQAGKQALNRFVRRMKRRLGSDGGGTAMNSRAGRASKTGEFRTVEKGLSQSISDARLVEVVG